jgi:hypothetical protein
MTVWLGNYNIPTDNGDAYNRQRDILKEALQSYGTDHVGGITVGNEFMLKYGDRLVNEPVMTEIITATLPHSAHQTRTRRRQTKVPKFSFPTSKTPETCSKAWVCRLYRLLAMPMLVVSSIQGYCQVSNTVYDFFSISFLIRLTLNCRWPMFTPGLRTYLQINLLVGRPISSSSRIRHLLIH